MNEPFSRHDQVLMSLVVNLQAMAMVQLGKVTHPGSGALARDLEEARATIDLLEMLKAKCRTGTPEPLLRLMDQAVLDLQMNYLDELKKDRREGRDQADDGDENGANDENDADDEDAGDAGHAAGAGDGGA
ncbi:MAG TPA: DUF1844 domain-containing protein [Candidatus Krumholzibacteria bacterium]|nr:DUF1844 domain-containing protein [Candidatus Krumholzibacteria bacterium]HPD71080.1 DUF1844 domain-containing protein [Candidatus Krumholzibacteria bacterium]HRY39220.1 DUF1844 domain-containing protein [Candidatus Krumholzibacteria bacterium]